LFKNQQRKQGKKMSAKPFKQWAKITQIKEPLLRAALATLDLSTEFGRTFATNLPEYFRTEEEGGGGRVSLSLLCAVARSNATKMEEGNPSFAAKNLVSYEATRDVRIPTVCFATSDYALKYFPTLPIDFNHNIEKLVVGDRVRCAEKRWVVVENNAFSGELHLAPEERILVDVPRSFFKRLEKKALSRNLLQC
jgi:hypothetical protein